LLSKNLKVHQNFNSQNGNSLESVMVHSLTLSYTLGSMRCDSQASFLARTLVNPYLGREPKARVATTNSKRGHEKLREEEFMGGFFLDYFS
jgi:hypothetical protein